MFRTHSGNYYVQSGAETFVCKLRGNLKKELVYNTSTSNARRVLSSHKRRATDPLTVGDTVRLDPELLTIEEIEPRKSELARTSPSGRGQHVLVANLDVVFVTCAAAVPRPDPFLLDKFLVMAEAADITPSLVVNKCDQEMDDDTRTALNVYERAGYTIHTVSAKMDVGMDELRAALQHKISAFAGTSGVGKSSLLNALSPGLTLKTGDISNAQRSGRHTTTTAELVPFGDDGLTWVADTPGLRQIDFYEIDRDQMQYCFPEFLPFLPECRFADCTHHMELGCAVRAAVESGTIDTRRYQSFLQMTDNAEK